VAPVTGATLKFKLVAGGQKPAGPVGCAGVGGGPDLTTAGSSWALLVPHEFVATTLTSPLAAVPFVEIFIVVVPWPVEMDHPEGTVQT
jgi:hypothetical protein